MALRLIKAPCLTDAILVSTYLITSLYVPSLYVFVSAPIKLFHLEPIYMLLCAISTSFLLVHEQKKYYIFAHLL